ncbi:uncharacterized protein METZ01_LOCUS449042, partial [marine metagenome]
LILASIAQKNISPDHDIASLPQFGTIIGNPT